jgi:DNA polymerase-1
VATVLFEELKLRPTKSKKTGYSTDISVLEELSSEHEVPALLAEYRQYEKLKGTYIDVLPTLICPATGRIHTSYNQAVAATGRLSSSDPNLQNIPIRSEWGRKIRAGFIPSDPEKNVLLSADYSQIELRVLAHVTQDPALVKAYTEEIDIHTLTASKVYGVDTEVVTSEMRAVAKMVNFGVIYGMSANGLSTRLKIPYATAKSFIDEYFRNYAGVRNWLDQTLVVAREIGYVETLAGRRRYLPDLRSKNFNIRNAAERVAMNMPIQGSSADMIKIAMINMQRILKESGLRTRMIMQVHDELVFDVPENELEQVQPLVRDAMQNAMELIIPVKVEMGYGKNWNEC